MFVRCRALPRTVSRTRPSGIRSAGTWSNLPRGPRILATALIAAGACGLSLGVYKYYQIPPSPYPEEVTKILRKALYYEGAGGNPKEAIQCYLQALEVATELGLDQTSDDMTGLKIKVGAVYESAGRLDSALRVYIGLLHELKAALQRTSVDDEKYIRLLRRSLGTSVKVGDLASQVAEYKDQAEQSYVWALESMLKENTRRNGDLSWLGEDSIGGIYQSAANFYYTANRPDLALPLFLKALDTMKNGTTCHTVTLLNNIASTLSSQSTAHPAQLNALKWAERAKGLKVVPKTAEEMAECELAYCMAEFNLGMINERLFKFSESTSHFRAARVKAMKIGAREGQDVLKMSDEGIARVALRQE